MAFKECPVCEMRCRVINTRMSGDVVRRRYKCDACDHRFTTAEMMVDHGAHATGHESVQLWARFVNVQTARKMKSLVAQMQALLSEPKGKRAKKTA